MGSKNIAFSVKGSNFRDYASATIITRTEINAKTNNTTKQHDIGKAGMTLCKMLHQNNHNSASSLSFPAPTTRGERFCGFCCQTKKFVANKLSNGKLGVCVCVCMCVYVCVRVIVIVIV